MTPDDKMAALFRADAPPARDFAFEALMAQRVARRRMLASIAAMVPPTTAAAAGLWGLQPVLRIVVDTLPLGDGDALTLAVSAAGLASVGAVLLVWGARRFSPR